MTQENRRIFTMPNIRIPSTEATLANTETVAKAPVLPIWAIAITAVGGAVVVGAIITGTVLCRRRNRKKNEPPGLDDLSRANKDLGNNTKDLDSDKYDDTAIGFRGTSEIYDEIKDEDVGKNIYVEHQTIDDKTYFEPIEDTGYLELTDVVEEGKAATNYGMDAVGSNSRTAAMTRVADPKAEGPPPGDSSHYYDGIRIGRRQGNRVA